MQQDSATDDSMSEESSDLLAASTGRATDQTHLLLLINGLFGGPANWDVVIENILKQQSLSHLSILAGTSNSRFQVPNSVCQSGPLSCGLNCFAYAWPSSAWLPTKPRCRPHTTFLYC